MEATFIIFFFLFFFTREYICTFKLNCCVAKHDRSLARQFWIPIQIYYWFIQSNQLSSSFRSVCVSLFLFVLFVLCFIIYFDNLIILTKKFKEKKKRCFPRVSIRKTKYCFLLVDICYCCHLACIENETYEWAADELCKETYIILK